MNTEIIIVFAIIFCFILFFFIIPFFVRAVLASRCKHKWNTFVILSHTEKLKEEGQCCELCGKVRYIKVKKD